MKKKIIIISVFILILLLEVNVFVIPVAANNGNDVGGIVLSKTEALKIGTELFEKEAKVIEKLYAGEYHYDANVVAIPQVLKEELYSLLTENAIKELEKNCKYKEENNKFYYDTEWLDPMSIFGTTDVGRTELIVQEITEDTIIFDVNKYNLVDEPSGEEFITYTYYKGFTIKNISGIWKIKSIIAESVKERPELNNENSNNKKEEYSDNLTDAENGKLAFLKLLEKNELQTEQHAGYYTYIDDFENKYNIKEIKDVSSEKGIMGHDNWASLFKVTVTYIDNNNKTNTMDLAIVLLPNHEIQNRGTYLNFTGTTSFVKEFSNLYDSDEKTKEETSNNKNDNTIKNGTIPQTGASHLGIYLIILLVIIASIGVIKYKRNK